MASARFAERESTNQHGSGPRAPTEHPCRLSRLREQSSAPASLRLKPSLTMSTITKEASQSSYPCDTCSIVSL